MPTKTWGPFNGRQLTTIIVALIVGVVMVPTGAFAVTTLKSVVINDPTGTHRALVDKTGSLQVAAAPPRAFFQNQSFGLSSGFVALASPPAGSALIVTTIHLDTVADPTPGNGQNVFFEVETGTCSGNQVGTYFQVVNPPSVGETDVPLSPGLGIPAGDTLCGQENGSVRAGASVSGYTVPAGTV
jgi:hypothetical protein